MVYSGHDLNQSAPFTYLNMHLHFQHHNFLHCKHKYFCVHTSLPKVKCCMQ